ncbi:unnamed protein product [Rodentolepis nana]|uniref:Secreted protein n=1 Tax=Rodentolepis nana TaxID=102285 RepID=A0A0R3T7K6_RODNA|nr:unnamed protein product [Rodentolepis nana]
MSNSMLELRIICIQTRFRMLTSVFLALMTRRVHQSYLNGFALQMVMLTIEGMVVFPWWSRIVGTGVRWTRRRERRFCHRFVHAQIW